MTRKSVLSLGTAAVLAAAVFLLGCASTPASEAPAGTASPAKVSAPAASTAEAPAAAEPMPLDVSKYEKAGFTLKAEKGRLWIFRSGSKELETFEKSGEPSRQVVRPGALNGVTVKAVDAATIDEYLATIPGFVVRISDGRLWVFREDTPALQEFLAKGEPSRQVVRPGAGPGGMTLKSSDFEVIDAYLAAYQAM
jgi:hypothetical protein